MKKVIFTSVLGLVVATLGIAPGVADTCVSNNEFSKIRNGMTESQIKRLTGTNGQVVSAAGAGKNRIVIRNYKACTKFGAVSILYWGGKVNSKSGIF
jgi:hypothetical protein